jgi:N-acetylglucosamine kinase-like BadF-type ATPase
LKNVHYFAGADVGGTKTHLIIADESGEVVGFGKAGPGNHEGVGYSGLSRVLQTTLEQACAQAGILPDQITGAGFGLGGLDFMTEETAHLEAISVLGLRAPVKAVNDSVIGLLAGSPNGWGVAVVAGTGCNCWGWDQARTRTGRVSGHGFLGEAAGASDLVWKAIQAVSHQWIQRGPKTSLTEIFIEQTGAADVEDLLEGITSDRYPLDPALAPHIFEAAELGDPVAGEVIRWAALELAELVKAVIRQLGFQKLKFHVVLVGSLYSGGKLLIEPMREAIQAFAPGANLVRLRVPPVIGAVLLGMETAGVPWDIPVRDRLIETLPRVMNRIK